MEPLSVASSIAGILGGVATVASKIHTLKQRYQHSELNLTLTSSMLFSVKRALESIQEMRDGSRDTSKASQQLDKDLNVPLESCAVLIAMIERGIEGIDIENPSRTEKWRFISLNETFSQAERSLDSQVRALSLLLQIYQCGTLAEQTERLKRRDTRAILDRVRRDTASTIQMLEDREGNDAASILSSEPSVKFMFDDDLLQHPMYQRVYPQLWRRKILRDRDSISIASPRQSVAVPPTALPPPVPRKDIPTDDVQTPTTVGSGSETIQASRAPPVPPKPASPQKTEAWSSNADTGVSSSTNSSLLSPRSLGRKGHKKKGSRSGRHDPLLGAIPDIPFLGTPFQGEQVDLTESSESELEDELIEQQIDNVTAAGVKIAAENDIAKQSLAVAAKAVPEEIPSESAETREGEETLRESEQLAKETVFEQEPQTQHVLATTNDDADSDLYGISDDEHELLTKPNIHSNGQSALHDRISHDIPTINEPTDDNDQVLPSDTLNTMDSKSAGERTESIAISNESVTVEHDPASTDIDRIVSHIRNHRARAASDAASATSLRSTSHRRSMSDTSGVNHAKLDIEPSSRPTSRGTSISANSDQQSQDAQESAREAFSPTLPSLGTGFGSFVVNFDQSSPDTKAAHAGPSSAPLSQDGEPTQQSESLAQVRMPPQVATAHQDRQPMSGVSISPPSPPRAQQMPVRAPPPPPIVQPSPDGMTTIDNPPGRDPPPPPASTEVVPTSAILTSPPVLPPAQPSPPSSADTRLSPAAKLNPPAIPPRPVLRPVSQPPPAVQNLSPQPSPLLHQSQMPESRSSTPGLSTDITPPVALKKAPPPPPPRRLSRSVAHRRTPSTSHATSTPEQMETVVVESPHRAPPPIPSQVAPSSPASTSSARASPQAPSKSHFEVQEEAHTSGSPLAETAPPTNILSPQRSPPSLTPTTPELTKHVNSDDASTIASTVTGSRNSGSFWDTQSLSSTHHTTVYSGLQTIATGSDGLPIDPADDTPEQANRRRIMASLGQQGQKERPKRLLPKPSKSRLSSLNLFSSKEKNAKIRTMHEAARDGRVEVLEEILQSHNNAVNGFEIVFPGDVKKTMLSRAAEGDHVACLQLLVRYHADVGLVDSHGQIALHHAIKNTSINATRWLAQNAAVSTSQMTTIEMGDEHGFRALHLAAAKGNLELIKILIQYGAMIDSRDKYGRSPLFTATIGSNLEAIDLLLAYGASLSQTDKKGRSPLMWAAEYDRPKVVELFRERNADRHARDLEGNTVFHVAAQKGLLNVIDALYLSKSDLEVANHLYERPLHLAAQDDKAPVVKGLLSIGCDPNVFTKPPVSTVRRRVGKKSTYKDTAATPLHYACANAAYDSAAALIENGASVNSNQEDGTSPLMLAAEAMSAPLVGLLLQFGANIDAKTSADHLSVLHVAAAAGDLETVKLLANNGASVRAVSKKNETPWQYGSKNGSKPNEATSWLSKFTKGQIVAAANRARDPTRIGPPGVAYPSVPSVPTVVYSAYPYGDMRHTATGYVPNHTTFYQPAHVEASPRTDEGIDPPPAYTPRAT